ncbi:unnamed protein product [Calicophoron daubneyi]|uniref:G-protein coupled receptors family 1 profile domain-containing protein n=1 Tax=Calicophoron daubneyi TaxID=300641 RepID=A0AAV2TWD2_CALDB
MLNETMQNETQNGTFPQLSLTSRYICLTYSILLLVFGTVGNILLVCTVIYKNVRKGESTCETQTTVDDGNKVSTRLTGRSKLRKHLFSPADQLLILLTASDLLCLWILVIRYTIDLGIQFDIRTASTVCCKIHVFLSFICSNVSIALLCVFAVHRALCIRWPLAAYTWLSRRVITASLIVTVIFITGKHFVLLFVFDVYKIDGGLYCDAREPQLLILGHYYFEFATNAVLGYAILIVSNIMLYISVVSKKRLQSHSHTPFNGQSANQRCIQTGVQASTGRHIARILLIFSILQLLTSTPFFVCIELSQLMRWSLVPAEHTFLVYYALLLAMFTNNAINYYVLLCISRQFRNISKEFWFRLLNHYKTTY